MTGEKLDEKAIFNVARSIDSPEARAEYLHQACGADANLIERVETLLRGYEEQASFLESPAAGSDADHRSISPSPNAPAPRSAPTSCLQQIGEGGMGVVFMAEQTEPVQRTGRAKDHQAGHGHPAGDRPLRGRAAGPGDDGPSEHRQGVGRRDDRQRAGRTS